jgi:hypothetical protein
MVILRIDESTRSCFRQSLEKKKADDVRLSRDFLLFVQRSIDGKEFYLLGHEAL